MTLTIVQTNVHFISENTTIIERKWSA